MQKTLKGGSIIMKKSSSVMMVALISVGVVFGCTKGYETQKSAGDVTVTLSAGSYPLSKAIIRSRSSWPIHRESR